MRLPEMKYLENRSQKQNVQFLGVNYGENTKDGELAQSRNISSRMFPCMSQRPGREKGFSYDEATAVWYRDGLLVVDGTDLIYNGDKIGTVMPGKKQFASVNTKVVIFPDKVMYDTATGELRSLEAEYVGESNALEFTDSKTLKVHMGAYRTELVSSGSLGGGSSAEILYETSDEYDDYDQHAKAFECKITEATVNAEDGTLTIGATNDSLEAEDWQQGDLFIDSSLGMDGVTSWGKITKKYTRTEWVDYKHPISGVVITRKAFRYVGYDYDRYEVRGTSFGDFTGFEAMNFREGDTVEISGCTSCPENNKVLTIRGFAEENVNGQTVYSLVFDAESFGKTGVEEGVVTIKRSVPNLTVICEKDNRLYGAKGHTIYVSTLGDPTNFNTFDGVDTDSYQVAVATEGDFTGCIAYGSSVLFFKEDCLHKLMGSYPSQYALYDYTVPGVLKGSENSLWNVNEVVYYHGREGVYRYSGGAPELVTENFGLRRFDTASAGALGYLYYISMRDQMSGAWGLWVYDILRDLWLQEDETKAVCFARDGGKLYYIDGSDSRLVLVNPESSQEAIEWQAVLCRMDEVYLNRKCFSKLLMRLELEEDAEIKIEVACDGGEWVEHKMFTRSPHKTVTVPIRPNRCDSFQIRLTGRGRAVIRSLVREFDVGSEI